MCVGLAHTVHVTVHVLVAWDTDASVPFQTTAEMGGGGALYRWVPERLEGFYFRVSVLSLHLQDHQLDREGAQVHNGVWNVVVCGLLKCPCLLSISDLSFLRGRKQRGTDI